MCLFDFVQLGDVICIFLILCDRQSATAETHERRRRRNVVLGARFYVIVQKAGSSGAELLDSNDFTPKDPLRSLSDPLAIFAIFAIPLRSLREAVPLAQAIPLRSLLPRPFRNSSLRSHA